MDKEENSQKVCVVFFSKQKKKESMGKSKSWTNKYIIKCKTKHLAKSCKKFGIEFPNFVQHIHHVRVQLTDEECIVPIISTSGKILDYLSRFERIYSGIDQDQIFMVRWDCYDLQEALNLRFPTIHKSDQIVL